MNIESLLNKIKVFQELVIESGFKRDVTDFKQSISQAQNKNLVFMKELSQKLRTQLNIFENNSLDSELGLVLRDEEPFTSIEIISELDEIDDDTEIDAAGYFQKFNNILHQLEQSIQTNETELDSLRDIFEKYVDDSDYDSDSEQAVMSLIFKDLKSTGGLKEFSKVLNRWNRTLIVYHTLLTSKSPEEISLVEIQNGSIDVIFNIDFDIAIDLTELIKTGLKVYGAYLVYKSKAAKEIIASYMGHKGLVTSETKRQKLMLDNIEDSIRRKAIEQHKERLNSDSPPSKQTAEKKAEEVAKVITDHIVKGNEVKLLTPPEPEDGDSQDLSSELRTYTATAREHWKKLDAKEKQLLLDKYTIEDDDIN